ncbi:hypothetical protein [Cryobacterium ruanii]|uniref:Uncharacterized protein n=1 Tax=Cryobacterium ruanii TaxID=1259197 RepID=A0A4V3IT63_9MICO|nr:hypothetical protein [Cryobacterium ruanii]TFD64235.1 hypothetical protein E3T47_12130 [Cryobacterium ruanii]
MVHGLSDPGGATAACWVSLGIGLIAFALFVVRQLQLQRTARALLDPRVFNSRTFTLSISMLGISMLALYGATISLFAISAAFVARRPPLGAPVAVGH